MRNMIEKYEELHNQCVALGFKICAKLNREGIRRRINVLLRSNGYRMRTPKVVDTKRCIKFETLYIWFHDDEVAKALSSVHPSFLFNADETEINRKGGAPGKVATPEGEQSCVVVEDSKEVMFRCF